MACILAVAEKPSVAKELTTIIAKQPAERLRRAGFSQYNHVFDIEHCLFKGEPARMRMTSVLGHMMEVEFDANYRSWSSCAPGDLFAAPVRKEVKKEAADLQRTLVAEAKKCNVLMLWLDCDLEGENIAYEVIKVCLEANPRLDVYRARFSALIERDILRTMRQPERPNPHMNDAVDARQEIDLRIGAAFTRFQTKRLQKKFDDVSKSVISYGPCQFPTLGFVVDRDLSIKQFEPEEFWQINCEGEFDNPDKPGTKMLCTFNWDRFRVYDRLAAVIMYDSCLEDGCVAKVIKCQEKPTSKRKPVPLNTIEFQILASRYLRMGSERAMAVAEALYHRGILSYPRTETNFFKEGFELMSLLVDHKVHSLWGQHASQLVDENKFEWPRHGGKDDQAHPPIHPTKCMELTALETDEERNVYELVSRHFIACCWKDAKGSQTTITVAIPDEHGETFSANGLMVLERNYLEVYSKYEHWSATKVPTVTIGDTFTPKKLMLADGKTCAPEPLSEADLITLMDKNGIGTDATIASHISTIQSREYAIKDNRNRFVPTNLGLALVEGYNSMGYQLNKPQLRAAIEADCQRVARGEMRKEDAVAKSISLMKNCFDVCSKEAHKLDRAMEKYFTALGAGPANRYDVLHRNLSTCGRCHEGMELRVERTQVAGRDRNRFLFCRQCNHAYNLPSRGDFQQHEVSCRICGFQVLTVTNPETNKEHTLCPYCYSNPPPPPDGVESVDDFRCFSCAKEDCVLAMRIAGSELNIAQCSDRNCNGHFRLKKNSKGYILACTTSSCKAIWWFPKTIKTVLPQAGNFCVRCQQRDNVTVLKLLVKFNLSTAPPGIPPEAVLCPSCDPIWDSIGQPKLPKKATNTVNATMNMPNNRSMASYTSNVPVYNPVIHLDQPSVNPPSYNTYAQPAPMQAQSYPNPYATSSNNRYPAMQEDNSFSYVSHHTSNPPPRPNNPYSSSSSNSNSHKVINLEDMGNTDIPQCGCGLPCKMLITNKEGPNKGRQFYSCSKPRDAGCSFFQWADEPPRSNQTSRFGGSSSSSNAGLPPIRPGNQQQQNAHFPNCNCGEKAVCLTTLKEGPNKDRQFYCCHKKRDDPTRCEYFQWTDQPPPAAGRGQPSTGGRGGQRTFQAASGNDVVCSICKEYGHYARQCTNKT